MRLCVRVYSERKGQIKTKQAATNVAVEKAKVRGEKGLQLFVTKVLIELALLSSEVTWI